MKLHFLEQPTRDAFCRVRSWLTEYTNDPEKITCRVCKELWEIQAGKRDTMSFGGDLDKNGLERKNKGRVWND